MPDLAPALLCPSWGRRCHFVREGRTLHGCGSLSGEDLEGNLGVQQVWIMKHLGFDMLLGWAAPGWDVFWAGGVSGWKALGFAGRVLISAHTGAWHLPALPWQDPNHGLLSALGSSHAALPWVCARCPRGGLSVTSPASLGCASLGLFLGGGTAQLLGVSVGGC